MTMAKILLITCGLAASSLALAEGGSDRAFDRMVKARDVAMDAHHSSGSSASESELAQQNPDAEKPHC